jgi:hypothetical protein
MVNFGLNSASILGLFLAVAGAGLYFLRSVRPELSRDHDIFFAAVGLLCGFILLFQGWRLDPILQFGQFLLTGSAIFFAVETVRLRGVATEQARRNTPIVDDDRPVSRVYRAELDQLESYETEEPYPTNRRLRGYQDPRSNRRSSYESEDPRNSKNRNRPERYSTGEPPRASRSSRPQKPPLKDNYDAWTDNSGWDEPEPPPSRPRRSRPENQPPEVSSRPSNRRRPSSPYDLNQPSVSNGESISTDYVDYQPIDPPDQKNRDSSWDQDRNRNRDQDNPVNFDY